MSKVQKIKFQLSNYIKSKKRKNRNKNLEKTKMK